jgi:hypothetical protein
MCFHLVVGSIGINLGKVSGVKLIRQLTRWQRLPESCRANIEVFDTKKQITLLPPPVYQEANTEPQIKQVASFALQLLCLWAKWIWFPCVTVDGGEWSASLFSHSAFGK